MGPRRSRLRTTSAILAVFLLLFTFQSLQAARAKAAVVVEEACAQKLVGKPVKRFRVGQLNVENLFDPIIDTGKLDKQFVPNASRLLPIGPKGRKTGNYDWNERKFEVKIAQIARTVKTMGNPPIMAIEEIESEFAAARLQAAMGYDGFIMTNSPDDRGVDVALFFKQSPNFKLLYRHDIHLTGEYYDQRASRNILAAGFLINGKHLFWFYVNHWPSQMGPPQSRFRAAQQLMADAHLRQMEIESIPVKSGYTRVPAFLAMGDFNVINEESPHAFDDVLLDENQPVRFVDVGAEFHRSKKISQKRKNSMPQGSYYYVDPRKKVAGQKTKTGTWNDLDRFIASESITNGRHPIQVDLESYQVHAPRFASMDWETDEGEVIRIPRPYDFNAETATEDTGSGDHFGKSVEFTVD